MSFIGRGTVSMQGKLRARVIPSELLVNPWMTAPRIATESQVVTMAPPRMQGAFTIFSVQKASQGSCNRFPHPIRLLGVAKRPVNARTEDEP